MFLVYYDTLVAVPAKLSRQTNGDNFGDVFSVANKTLNDCETRFRENTIFSCPFEPL